MKMVHFKALKPRALLLMEGIALAGLVVIVGFLGFFYINNHQKLASSQQPTIVQTNNVVTPANVKPITDKATLDEAAKQLAAIDTEAGSDNCAQTLIADIDSIESQ